jgi:hypothetical protein
MNNITFVSGFGVDPERFDLYIIPQFIDHYKSLGITDFRIIVHAETEEKTKEGINLLRRCGVEPYYVWVDTYIEENRNKILNSTHEKITTKWVITVDGDEFLELNSIEFKDLLMEMDSKNYELAEAVMVDRIGTKDTIEKASLWEQYPFESNITETVVKGYTRKIFLFQPYKYWEGVGGHYVTNKITGDNGRDKLHPRLFKLAHFKWTPTVVKRIKSKYVAYKGKPWITELDRTIEFIENGGIKSL